MKKWWHKFYQENKSIVWAAGFALILTLGILIKVRDEVTRFTLIMPIFAGFILFSILVTSDEELDSNESEEKKPIHTKKSTKK